MVLHLNFNAIDMPAQTETPAPRDPDDLGDRQQCQTIQKEEFQVLEVWNMLTVSR